MNLKSIGRLDGNLKTDLKDRDKVLKGLNEILTNSVEKNIDKETNHGLAFSGGVDSSLIALLCKKLKKNFTLYTVSIGEDDDVIWSRKAANHLKLSLNTKVMDYDEAFTIIKKVCNIFKTNDPVKTGIACVLFSALELMKKDKIKDAITGLGSDTLFFGFEKHRKAFENKTILKESIKGVKEIYKNDIKRDLMISGFYKINLICPFLDKEVIRYSMRIDPKLKINKEQNKVILRELAYGLGLKKEFAFRKKVASQYGSGFDKAISVLARENGFEYKREFLNSLLK
ncbi:asparagine synthase [Candidatus Woesearchaeota archaeon]|nr:asparagine synthase [Candidatus Woesearchaeota archaeon]